MVVVLVAATIVAAFTVWPLWEKGFTFEPEHGDVIAVVDGIPIHYHREGRNKRGRYGLEYQCVEFVNRWLVAKGFKNLTRTGDAHTYFTEAKSKGLTAYSNGGDVAPKVGDILVFSSSDQKYGHVAIVLEVNENSVKVAQQNATIRTPSKVLVKPVPYETFALERGAGRFRVHGRTTLTCLGWSRVSPAQTEEAR